MSALADGRTRNLPCTTRPALPCFTPPNKYPAHSPACSASVVAALRWGAGAVAARENAPGCPTRGTRRRECQGLAFMMPPGFSTFRRALPTARRPGIVRSSFESMVVLPGLAPLHCDARKVRTITDENAPKLSQLTPLLETEGALIACEPGKGRCARFLCSGDTVR